MKDLYEFLAERDVPFARPVVKALVTKVYRQVCPACSLAGLESILFYSILI